VELTFGEKLQIFRQRAQLTQSNLAKLAKSNTSFISRIEADEMIPSQKLLQEIITVLEDKLGKDEELRKLQEERERRVTFDRELAKKLRPILFRLLLELPPGSAQVIKELVHHHSFAAILSGVVAAGDNRELYLERLNEKFREMLKAG